MTQALTSFINDAGLLAPLYYIAAFLISALLPFIPTPLIGALGGKAFGLLPAVAYGILGLGLGAFTALSLARHLGRPLLLKLLPAKTWDEWEKLLGIESPITWGAIFFVLNLDFVVLISGLTRLPLAQLWLAAMIARLPWLIASAWFGDHVLVSDTVMILVLILMIPLLYALQRVRPLLQRWLLSLGAGGPPRA